MHIKPNEIKRRIQSAVSEAQPFVDLIVRVRHRERPKYELTADGLNKIDDGLTDVDRSIIQRCEESIAYIYSRHGLETQRP